MSSKAGPVSAGGSAALTNASINLVQLREVMRSELVRLLDTPPRADPMAKDPPSSALVLDQTLSGPLGLVAEVDLFKKHNVAEIYHLHMEPVATALNRVVYILRPDVRLVRVIAAHARALRSADREIFVFFVPRMTIFCEHVLQEEGVAPLITKQGELQLDLIPFDNDLLSLESPRSFREVFLDGDPSALYFVAQSLMKLQTLFGLIPTVRGKGDNAWRVYQLMHRLRKECGYDDRDALSGHSEIDELIIIDRSVDMVTPLLTQLTYEGLIDELFGIKNTYVDVDAEIVGGKAGDGKKKLCLNSADSLFQEIRDLNFRVLGPLLHKKAQFVKETYDERHGAQDVRQMSKFMKKFKTAHQEHTFLQTHINVAETISKVTKSKRFDRQIEVEHDLIQGNDLKACEEYIEERIAQQEPFPKVLRLLCLLSLTYGIKPKRVDFWKRELVHTYGFDAMFTINNLESLGLFNRQVKRSGWSSVRKGLQLYRENVDLNSVNDNAHLYNGYAPLSCRIVEAASSPGGWKRLEDILNILPGRMFEGKQDGAAGQVGGFSRMSSVAEPDAAAAGSSAKKPRTLVYFVGGVTFSEMSVLRNLSARENGRRDYLVASTKLINGTSLLRSVIEVVENGLDKTTMPTE